MAAPVAWAKMAAPWMGAAQAVAVAVAAPVGAARVVVAQVVVAAPAGRPPVRTTQDVQTQAN